MDTLFTHCIFKNLLINKIKITIMTTATQTHVVQSPFANLNQRLLEQNGQAEELLSTLRSSLDRISDTNLPKEEQLKDNKADRPILPFYDGLLMAYHDQLNRQANYIQHLAELVSKINNLV